MHRVVHRRGSCLCSPLLARAHLLHRFGRGPGGNPECVVTLRRALLQSRRTAGHHVGKSTNHRARHHHTGEHTWRDLLTRSPRHDAPAMPPRTPVPAAPVRRRRQPTGEPSRCRSHLPARRLRRLSRLSRRPSRRPSTRSRSRPRGRAGPDRPADAGVPRPGAGDRPRPRAGDVDVQPEGRGRQDHDHDQPRAPRWRSSAARCSWSTSTRRGRSRSGWGSTPTRWS